MKPAEIARYRLVSQQIVNSKIQGAGEMVKWFGAVQGQEYALSKWGLGLRLKNVKDKDVEKSFSDGTLLRTHILRPTWHFVHSDDIRWMLKISAPRVHAVNAYMYRQSELDKKILNRCQNIFSRALEGGKALTRSELSAELRRKKIALEGIRLACGVMYGELEGVITSGPRRGSQHTYMLLDERIPAKNDKTHEEALAELTRRYFSSRGPSTIRDFSTWSGLTLTECKKGVESVRSLLKEISLDEKHFFSSSASEAKRDPKIHLLPIYDEYIMGYKDRSAISLEYAQQRPGKGLAFDSTIIFDGQIVGSWKRTIRGKKIDVSHELFLKDKKVKGSMLDKVIERFKNFTAPD